MNEIIIISRCLLLSMNFEKSFTVYPDCCSKMLSTKVLEILKFYLLLNSELYAIPYDWDKSKLQVIDKSRIGRTIFAVVLLICETVRCCHLYSIFENIFMKTEEAKVIFCYCVGCVGVFLTSAIHISFWIFKTETAFFLNRFLYFLRRKYIKFVVFNS